MQPWSVMWMCVVFSRRWFSAREALRRPSDPDDRAGRRPHSHARARAARGCRNFFGRVLQVGIKGDDDLAGRVLESGEDRRVLAEVALKQDHVRFPRARSVLGAQQRDRAIGAAVVHEDALVRCAQLIERLIEPHEQLRQAGLLVEDRHDDADFGADCRLHDRPGRLRDGALHAVMASGDSGVRRLSPP